MYKCIYRLIELGLMLSGIDPLSFISKGGGIFWVVFGLSEMNCARGICSVMLAEITMTFVKYVKL